MNRKARGAMGNRLSDSDTPELRTDMIHRKEAAVLLERFMDGIRPCTPSEPIQRPGVTKWAPECLALIPPYFEESESEIRLQAAKMITIMGLKSEDTLFRQNAAKLLFVLLRPGPVKDWIEPLRMLAKFKRADFTEDTKRRLLDAIAGWAKLRKRAENQRVDALDSLPPNMIRLIGVADLKEAVPILKQIEAAEHKRMGGDPFQSNGRPYYVHVTWYCLMARARMGDAEALDRMIGVIEVLPKETDRIAASKYLSYTRQLRALKYMKPFLYSEIKRFGTNGAAGQTTIMTCASYTQACLWSMLPDLPVHEGIEASRAWIEQQTEWHIEL